MKRVHEYIFKLRKVLGLWPGRRTLCCGPDFDIHLHFDGARQIQAVCFEAFSNGLFFFLSLSPGHNPECGPDKVTFVHRASDSLSLRLPGCLPPCLLPAWAIDEVREARMPFSAICVGNTICSKAENFMPIQKPNQMPFTYLTVSLYACVCELSN